MYIDVFRAYCMAKKGVTESFPFDDDVLVFKVLGKVFALSSLKRWEASNPAVNLKCNPIWAVELREKYMGITPGFHMHKKHWNTVLINQDISDDFIEKLIDHSYDLVVQGLPKKVQDSLQ